jgi:hypothetical protein
MPWGKRPRIPQETLFWSKVDKSPGYGPKGDCWLWRGGRRGSRVSKLSDTLYGGVRFEGRIMLAHRVAFLLTHKTLSSKDRVIHSCDVPACVNPSHLAIGTQKDNMRDCWKKGRGFVPGNSTHQRAQGEASGKSKLTTVQVREIRRLHGQGETLTDIASLFNVTYQNVRSIISGRTWGHVL